MNYFGGIGMPVMADAIEVLRAARQSMKLFNALLHPVGEKHQLSNNELLVLGCLAADPQMNTSRDLADLLCWNKSRVSKSVDVLMRRGLVQGRQDPHDRRCIRLQGTPQAMDIVCEVWEVHQKLRARCLEGIPPDQQKIARQVAMQMLANARRLAGDLPQGGQEGGPCGQHER